MRYRYVDSMVGYYFGQDWFDEWPDEASAMADFVSDNDEERRRATLDELLQLRTATATAAEMDKAFRAMSHGYGPLGGPTPYADFADRLIAYISASLPDAGPVEA